VVLSASVLGPGEPWVGAMSANQPGTAALGSQADSSPPRGALLLLYSALV
jgi:hypothetical protein